MRNLQKFAFWSLILAVVCGPFYLAMSAPPDEQVLQGSGLRLYQLDVVGAALRVGEGSTPDVTPGEDDLYVEGTFEVDGAVRLDGGLTLVNGTITTAMLGDDSVTTSKLISGAVTTIKLEDDSVTTSKINEDAVTTSKIATDAVLADSISGGAVTTSKHGTDSVLPISIISDAGGLTKVSDGAAVALGGNVGIGSLIPNQELTISSGTLLIDGDQTTAIQVAGSGSKIISFESTTNGYDVTFNFYDNSAVPVLVSQIVWDEAARTWNFIPAVAGANVSALFIAGDGDVGVGSAGILPIQDFHVLEASATTSKLGIGGVNSAGCLMIGDIAEDGTCTECRAVNGTLTCTDDSDCVCDGS